MDNNKIEEKIKPESELRIKLVGYEKQEIEEKRS